MRCGSFAFNQQIVDFSKHCSCLFKSSIFAICPLQLRCTDKGQLVRNAHLKLLKQLRRKIPLFLFIHFIYISFLVPQVVCKLSSFLLLLKFHKKLFVKKTLQSSTRYLASLENRKNYLNSMC